MSFDIFASGVNYGGNVFNYRRPNFAGAGDVDLVGAISELQSMTPNIVGVLTTAASFAQPSVGASDLFGNVANRIALRGIDESIQLLAARANSLNGSITVSLREKHFVFPTTSITVRYCFNPSTSSGADFVSQIRRGLDETHTNDWGVFLQLWRALAAYDVHLNSDTPMLLVFLTKN